MPLVLALAVATIQAAGEQPDIVPAKRPAVIAPRNWGDTFLPKSPPPVRRVAVVHHGALTAEERIALTCLQGLVARDAPRIVTVRSPDVEEFWLEWHAAKGYIDGFDPVADWTTLVDAHRDRIKGVVVPDAALFRGDVLALNVAACEDLLVASPQLAARLKLPVAIDLRGRFPTYAGGMEWLWKTYEHRLNPHLCDFRHPRLLPYCTFDYGYQWRALMFWIAGPGEAGLPGVDREAERRLMERILGEMPVGGVCIGFPGMGDGEGMGEPTGVELLSRFGKSLVCTNHAGNHSFWSAVKGGRLEPPRQPPPPALHADTIYIALALSDGDNQVLWPAYFRKHFEHPAFGTFPLAFGMGPAIHELQPGVARWYYEHAAPTTEFIADVSGAGYMAPQHFASAYTDAEQVWAGYLDRTRRLMEPLGMRSIRTVSGDDAVVERFAAALPACHSILADMGRYSGREGIGSLTYVLPGGTPVFRAATSWRYGKQGFLREVREQVGNVRPAFVNGFVHCWTFDMDAIAKIHAERDADMVFVTPSQLAQLYRRFRTAREVDGVSPSGGDEHGGR